MALILLLAGRNYTSAIPAPQPCYKIDPPKGLELN